LAPRRNSAADADANDLPAVAADGKRYELKSV